VTQLYYHEQVTPMPREVRFRVSYECLAQVMGLPTNAHIRFVGNIPGYQIELFVVSPDVPPLESDFKLAPLTNPIFTVGEDGKIRLVSWGMEQKHE
jgi:hypothetical protein